MQPADPIVAWLMEGDPAIRWQTMRDLSNAPSGEVARERARMPAQGWTAALLSLQGEDGLWGGGIYTPKWTSTTYTLLLLRDFGLAPGHSAALLGCRQLISRNIGRNGGISYFRNLPAGETCVTGMVLSICCAFRYIGAFLENTAGHLLEGQMPDGGWNCRRGATHSSFHTTISVLEGLLEYERTGRELSPLVHEAQRRGREFLLAHRLFRSHRTGKIVHPELTRLHFPPRWHYDILRALDYIRASGAAPDPRLEDAIGILTERRRPDGRWLLARGYPGKVAFELERAGEPSRWNTLRCRRVLQWWASD